LLCHQSYKILRCIFPLANSAGNKEQIQNVIENNIIPPLIQLLVNAEFDIRKEAAWAISNATSGGNEQQIKFLVQQGCIRALCKLLSGSDTRIVTIALEGLENILKVGAKEATATGTTNQMALMIVEVEGHTKIECLQRHPDIDIQLKASRIVEAYLAAV
jgi:importin subunit alpha-6/7